MWYTLRLKYTCQMSSLVANSKVTVVKISLGTEEDVVYTAPEIYMSNVEPHSQQQGHRGQD